ncbi:MAG: glycosyltransferase [Polyangiaceae bacterium]|nr:glycosyltransferase [Polyangiaceae bacterium]
MSKITDSFEQRFGSDPWVTVIIATYNRADSLRRLLEQFDRQTLDPSHFEVIAVDDGSQEVVGDKLADLETRYALRIERQANSGAAVARQHGVSLARGKIIVVIDDDMQIKPDFLERHLDKHDGDDTVVLGRLRPDAHLAEMPLFERFYARTLARNGDAFASGEEPVRGHNIYTGNVSFPRDLFMRVGGFDPQFRALEDEEIGIRFEKAGARFAFANDAESMHGSDWTSMRKWMERSFRDGVYQTKVAHKHKDHFESQPWRHWANINPMSRPILAFGIASPKSAAALANAAIRTAAAFDKIGLEPVALAGATLVYGIQYYRGVRAETGSALDTLREYREFKRGMSMLGRGESSGGSSFKKLVADIREDNRMIRFYQDKYDGRVGEGALGANASPKELVGDGIRKIGYQIMVAYRIMRFLRDAGLMLGAQFMSRLIRHAFASDIHWDAELEPGIVIIHGFGLAISYAAKVRTGSILFQNITLGYGLDPDTKIPGAPVIEKNVHIGVGATLFGPITIGEGTKIMAGCVINHSVPPRSIVEASIPHISARGTRKRSSDDAPI